MKNLISLSNKFAMKLGLESRPSSSIGYESSKENDDDPFEQVLYQGMHQNDASETSTKMLDTGINDDAKNYINGIRILMHDISNKLDMGDFDEIFELISNAQYGLSELESLVAQKINK